MRTYVGDRSGGEPRVLVVERTLHPDPAEIVEFLGNLSRLHEDDTVLPLEEQAARRAHLMADKEVLLARIRAAEEPRITPLPQLPHGSDVGIDWGYHGSEAFELARSILAHETGEEQPAALTARFADEVVAHLPWIEFSLPATEVGYWMAATADRRADQARATAPTPPDVTSDASPALAVADPGLEVPGDAPADEPTASALVAACEEAWKAIQDHHPEVPDAVVVLGSGVERGRLVKLGHWWNARWLADGEVRGEVLLAGEALHLPPAAVFEVLLHEAAHGLSAARGVKDTSRGGRYHNGRFRDAAEEVGLVVEPMAPYGQARTSLSPPSEERYAGAIARLGDAMRIARQVEARTGAGISQGEGQEADGSGPGTGGTRSRTSALAQCPCGRKLRMAPTVLAAGPVLCGVCEAEFAGEPRRTPEQAEELDSVVDHSFLARRRAAVAAEADDSGPIERAIDALERQWTTIESALAGSRRAHFATTMEPLRQRRELVRVLLEELRGEAGTSFASSPQFGLTPVQRDGVTELLDAPALRDPEVERWYQRFGTAQEQPMGGNTDSERHRRTRLARALLKADGTLTGPAIDLRGREFMVGERVVVTEDDLVAGVPAGVLGTVEQVHPDEGTMSVDFATLGRLKISLADSLADRLSHDYVSLESTPEPRRNGPSRELLTLEAQRSAPEVEV
ncbi:MAG: DUF6166 domain-containing protein [Actinomycetota bacterium]